MSEWTLRSGIRYPNPFVDLTVDATFTGPTGQSFTIPAFYDADDLWRIRFNPGEPGRWTYRTTTCPLDRDLTVEGSVKVVPSASPGFLWKPGASSSRSTAATSSCRNGRSCGCAT